MLNNWNNGNSKWIKGELAKEMLITELHLDEIDLKEVEELDKSDKGYGYLNDDEILAEAMKDLNFDCNVKQASNDFSGIKQTPKDKPIEGSENHPKAFSHLYRRDRGDIEVY